MCIRDSRQTEHFAQMADPKDMHSRFIVPVLSRPPEMADNVEMAAFQLLIGFLKITRALAHQNFEMRILIMQQRAGFAQTQMGTYPSQQNRRRDWLGYVIDSAQFKACLLYTSRCV